MNLKKTCLINTKAQTLTELATFGSLVLFCLALLIQYGLQMNYQQNIQMQAFRKALKLAHYKQGPSSTASFVMVKDKPIVDPRDQWGFADRVALASGASVTWSNSLNSLFIENIQREPDQRDLPRMYIEISKDQDKGMGLDVKEINDNLDKNNVGTEAKGVFTTAEFKEMSCAGHTFGIFIEDSGHEKGPVEYYMILKNPNEINVYEGEQDPTSKSAVYQYAGLRKRLTSVLIDPPSNYMEVRKLNAKLRQVDILAVEGTEEECKDGYCGTLKQIRYIDSAAGRIDTYYTDVRPEDKDKALAQKQGFLSEYNKEMNFGSGAKIVIKETSKGISTRTESQATQKITHKIRLNDGTVREVPVEFKQPAEAYKWGVSYE